MSSIVDPRIATYLADAAITKGMAVKIGTDRKHVAKCSANTDKAIGIAANSVTTAEDAVEVYRAGGGGKALLGESSILSGSYLVPHTDGTLVLANAAGDAVCAVACEPGASGDLIEVDVQLFEAYNAE